MIWREFDPTPVNAIINHPEVLPSLSLGAFDHIDVSPVIANPRNVFLMGEHGGCMFIWTGPGVFDSHDFVLPEGRGRWAMATGKGMLQAMFGEYRARLIWAQTPVENRACRMFNRLMGFRSEGIESAILIPGTPARDVELFVMEAPCQQQPR